VTASADERAAAAAQVFVTDPAAPVLDPDDLHHLSASLRLRPDEVVIASDGAGRWCPCRFLGAHRGAAETLVPDGAVSYDPPGTPAITIAFAPVKGERPEWVVQKLTEVGVDRIVALMTERSVVRWDGARGERMVERLARVARAAAAQSRRAWLPRIEGVSTLGALTQECGPDLALADRGGGTPSTDRPVIVVGPEGGWSEAELAAAPATVGLGPTVLRAETAAVVAGSLLSALRAGTVGPQAGGAVRPEASTGELHEDELHGVVRGDGRR